jgi:hypothetical protein
VRDRGRTREDFGARVGSAPAVLPGWFECARSTSRCHQVGPHVHGLLIRRNLLLGVRVGLLPNEHDCLRYQRVHRLGRNLPATRWRGQAVGAGQGRKLWGDPDNA